MKPPLHPRLNHHSPDWVNDPVYFITICAKERTLNQLCQNSAKEILHSIQVYHEKQRWHCHLALLMPDHVHFLLSFGDKIEFPDVIGDWKRWVTLYHQIAWQENFFEHQLRNEESFGQKADYILHNPVRAGLVRDWKDWPHFWMSE